MSSPMLLLSPEQRRALFQATGQPLRRLAIRSHGQEAIAIDRCCRRCLLADDLPGVWIGTDGLCNQCVEHDRVAATGAFSPQLAQDVVQRYRGSGSPDCIVAFSGGKDSALTLLLAVQELGLRPLAVLVDNGFIPQEIQDNSHQYCKQFGVELVVERIDIRNEARSALQDRSGKVPCATCISNVFSTMARKCRENDLRLVLGGHRFPPLTYPVSAFTKRNEDDSIVCVSPLLARRISEDEQLALISHAGWKRVAFAGNTSNCKLIGVVEEHLYDIHGYNPHLYEVSKEIRGGFYDRMKGYEKVERPRIEDAHRRWVMERLDPNGTPTPLKNDSSTATGSIDHA